MKRSKVLSLSIVIVAVCGTLLLFFWSKPEPARVGAPSASSAAPRVRHAPFTIPQLYAEGQAKAGGDAVKPDSTKIDVQASVVGLDDAVEEALTSDPQLRKFYELRKKALRSSAEQQDYLDMIADPKLIEAARQDLLAASSESDVDQTEELRRTQRIAFLNSALAWEDNPARATALDAVTQVVMAEVPAGAPNAVAGSVLGDKFDLFQLLMASDPDQAQVLLALKARGTATEKILALAWETGKTDKNTQHP